MPDPGVREADEVAQQQREDQRNQQTEDTASETGWSFDEDEEEEEVDFETSPGSLPDYEEDFGEPMNWQEMVASRIPGDVADWAEAVGEDPFFAQSWIQGRMPDLLYYLDEKIGLYQMNTARTGDGMFNQAFFESAQGLEFIYNMALDWVQAQDARFAALPSRGGRGRGRGRGSGGGRRGPTPDEIRAQFDIDELSDRVNDLWFNAVLDSAPNPRGLAKAYVETIVKDPEQKVDFDTFVRKRVENSKRYKTIYRRKPEGMPHEQFLQPLYQTALQAAGPERAADLATSAARFGGDPTAFRERLTSRADVARNTAPFMQRLEQGMSGLSGILKG